MSDLKSKLAAGVRAVMEEQDKPAQGGEAEKTTAATRPAPRQAAPATPAKRPQTTRRATPAKTAPKTAVAKPAAKPASKPRPKAAETQRAESEAPRAFPRRRVWPD